MVKYREEAGVSTKMYESGFPIGFKAATEEVRLPPRSVRSCGQPSAMRPPPTV
jgi:hypothetical protein